MSSEGGPRGGASDARGVSQVVGIALLIAIVVLLVGATGTYLTGFSGELEEPPPRFAPSVKYNHSFVGDAQSLTVTHQSGSTIPTDDIRLRVQDATVHDPSNPSSRTRAVYQGGVLESQAGQNFTADETFVVNKTAFRKPNGNPLGTDEYLNLSEAEVRMVWSTADGTRTSIIFEWRGPNDFNPAGE
jgi:hypothetical protein